MKCLCASKNCRGVIGGTQEGKEGAVGAAARAAALEQAVDVPEEEDPDFIMVTGTHLILLCFLYVALRLPKVSMSAAVPAACVLHANRLAELCVHACLLLRFAACACTHAQAASAAVLCCARVRAPLLPERRACPPAC